MSVVITKTCDRCGATSSDKEKIWFCWVPTTLSVTVSMARFTITVDLCPSCQDVVFNEINETRRSKGVEELEAGKPYDRDI